MRAVIQRVTKARVLVKGRVIASINQGFLVFLAVAEKDTEKQAAYLAKKVVNLRIMADAKGKMNQSIKEVNGQLLIVSQFTLLADCSQGNRPSFAKAAPAEKAQKLYQYFIRTTKALGAKVQSGIFKAMMKTELVNDGPVTVIINTP